VFFTDCGDEKFKDNTVPDPASRLPRGPTSRDCEIVQLLAEGKTTKEVASVLGINVKTADTHRANIMRKSQVVRYAV